MFLDLKKKRKKNLRDHCRRFTTKRCDLCKRTCKNGKVYSLFADVVNENAVSGRMRLVCERLVSADGNVQFAERTHALAHFKHEDRR